MSKASEQALGELHALLAQELADRIKGVEEVEDQLNEEGEVIGQKRRVVKATAAELAVARGLLKDNNITATPEQSSAVAALQDALAQRKANRVKPPTAEEIMRATTRA